MSVKYQTFIFFLFFIVLSSCNIEAEIENIKQDIDIVAVPEYYKKQLHEKDSLICNAILNASNNYCAFVFFTDAHWNDNQKNSPSLIKHICYNTKIEDVIFGGDAITRFDTPNEAFLSGQEFRHSFDTLNFNMYYIYGNHDNNSDCYPDLILRHLNDNQVYDYLQKGMSDCKYGDFYNFYFDRDNNKTRYICLDTGRFYYPQLRTPIVNTARFLINTLNSTPDDWNIIVISHIWLDLSYDTPRAPFLPDYMRLFTGVLDGYNLRISSSFIYGDETIDYDFSNSNSKIVCCLGGHCHTDYIQYTAGGIPIVITTTDSLQTINEVPATKGTTDEQAVSVFVVDYNNSLIQMFRIGRGDDVVIPISLVNS